MKNKSLILISLFVSSTLLGFGFGKYNVVREGDNLILTCENRRKVRIHTSQFVLPYGEAWCDPNNLIKIYPGQWVEGHADGKLFLLSDADNR